jgi:hypothetical protein
MSVGLIDFFVLEASDYVDRLHRLTGVDEPRGPDAASLLKLSRGLRGSAVMARLNSFADAASALERGARLLLEGRIAWTPELGGAVRRSVQELRALIPMARLWDESHDERARLADNSLTAVLDAVEQHGAAMQAGGGEYVAADLPLIGDATPVAVPVSAEPNTAVTAFLNTIDHRLAPPVAAERRPARLTPLPNAARASGSIPPATPTAGMTAMTVAPMPIVPIATLAPDNDADAVVFRAPQPAVTFAQRFIGDVTPLIASLRARLTPLRHGAMQHASADMVAAFRPVLVSLRDISASYEHEDIRAFCDAILTTPAPLPAPAAGALDTALTVMLQQDLAPHIRAQRLTELRRVVFASTPLSTAAQSAPPTRSIGAFGSRVRTPMNATIIPTPMPAPSTARVTPSSAPSGRELSSLLSTSLEKVRELEKTPLDLITVSTGGGAPSQNGPDGEPDVVMIDSLLYRGPRALSRARHIVGQLRSEGHATDSALISELFDLVELAGSGT